ncbi:MAG: protein-L-isoaspartate O-methyltransferase family protein, partial [Sphingobacteriales bacterium]
MTDFTTARRHMVDGQVRTADVTDLRIISAMLEIPRERFVPAALADLAYLDLDLPVGDGTSRRLLKPMVLAKLIQAADLAPDSRVLDVGCATGYGAAVLARI